MTQSLDGKMFDLLGFGAVAIDHLVYVDSFPPANVKTYVIRSEQQCGGLTATALVAAQRLGTQCAYAGTLGDDDGSRYVLDVMQREGIDVSHVVKREGAGPIRSTIIVGLDHATRNIFPEHPAVAGAAEDQPDASVIRAAKVVFVDHLGIAGMIRAATIARDAGIPVVSDVERDLPGFDALLALVDHVVVGEDFALRLTHSTQPEEAAQKLWTPARSLVAVTCGEAGCTFTEDGATVQHQPAFKVDAIDTTGCGDVFHGAYAAALAKGMPAAERIRFASAAAALKATQRGGQAGAPTLAQVNAFLS